MIHSKFFRPTFHFKKGILIIALALFQFSVLRTDAQTNASAIQSPLDVLKLVGNKLIKETPFKYQLSLATPSKTFSGIQAVDFGRSFGLGKPGVAYATTILTAPDNMDFDIQLEHNDACKIWLNNKLVYEKDGERKTNLVFEERSVRMSFTCKLPLLKGKNTLLIKSVTAGAEWKVLMQPPSTNGAILNKGIVYPAIGLSGMKYVDKSVSNISNWLVVGPFDNINGTGLETVYEPEKQVRFGYMYEGKDELITWTIPKIEIQGGMINPKLWGTSYNWNYHNGGTAWAM